MIENNEMESMKLEERLDAVSYRIDELEKGNIDYRKSQDSLINLVLDNMIILSKRCKILERTQINDGCVGKLKC